MFLPHLTLPSPVHCACLTALPATTESYTGPQQDGRGDGSFGVCVVQVTKCGQEQRTSQEVEITSTGVLLAHMRRSLK